MSIHSLPPPQESHLEDKATASSANPLLGVLEASLDEIYIFDAATLRFEYVSASARKNLGYEMEELRGKTPLDLKSELTGAALEELADPLRRGEKPRVVFETVHRRADGTVYPVEVHLQLVDTHGRAVFLAVTHDITERRRANTAMFRLAAIVESSPDAIFGTDFDSVITSWNAGAETIFGYSAAEMVGTHITRIIPEDRRHENDLILKTLQRGEQVFLVETLRRTRDGRLIDVSVSASPIRDHEGRIIGTSRIIRDITVLKTREREIARLSRLYAALSQVNQAIVITHTRGALFQKVCQVLVEQGGFQLAWIGWDDAVTHQLVPVAAWGDENNYIRNILVYSDDRPEGQGPSGVAFRENRPYVCNDLLADPATVPWRAEIQRRGFRASVALPIRTQHRVRGTLSVYADEPGFFRDKELALLTEAAENIAFGLDNFARNEESALAERKLRLERDFSEAMLNSLPGVLYLFDQSGQFLRWNSNFEEVTGYTAAEIAAMHPLDFFAGADREFVAARIKEVFGKGASYIEAGFLTKDGRSLPYCFTGVETQFDGRTCLVGVGIDITERRQAELALREAELRFHTLFDQTPVGVVVIDPATATILECNEQAARQLGYSASEFARLGIADFEAAETCEDTRTHIDELVRVGQDHFETRHWTRSGELRDVFVTGRTIELGGRTVIHCIFLDITARKAAVAALRQLNANLEQIVAERTRELQATATRAEAADRLKSAFLATMSHELRTPLNSIIGFTGTVLQGLAGPVNEEQQKQLGMVRSSARHLLELINDVLDLSKIEAGQLRVRSEPFNLPDSLSRVIAMITPLAERKGLGLDIRVAPDLGEMVSDRRRVEQIALNLLNNAIKFTARGTITLNARRVEDYRSTSEAPPQPALRLSIADTGIGIRDVDQTNIFLPFRQVDTGLSRQHEGTGLGLAICRRLATLLGGQISVTSELAKGSEFTVFLPLQGPPDL